MKTRMWLLIAAAITLLPLTAALASPAPSTAGQTVVAADQDRDGIPDSVENKAAYKHKGGSPKHQDIWVQVDYMKGLKPATKTAAYDVAAFKAAPITNPDGKKGITLHVVPGVQIKFEANWGDVTSQSGFVTTYNKLKAARAAHLKAPFGIAAAKNYTHYSVFVNQISPQGTSGISMDSTNMAGGIPGDMFIVALGGPWGADGKKAEYQAGTWMHELGHNIGLTHGGAAAPGGSDTHYNYKPNYLSVMNYDFQFGFYGEQGGNIVRLAHWDYTTWKANILDENHLKEPLGVTAPPAVASKYMGVQHCASQGGQAFVFNFNKGVDWNCDGNATGASVAADINADNQRTKLGTQNNWASLVYDGGSIGGVGSGVASLPAETNELTPALFQGQQRMLARGNDAAVANLQGNLPASPAPSNAATGFGGCPCAACAARRPKPKECPAAAA